MSIKGFVSRQHVKIMCIRLDRFHTGEKDLGIPLKGFVSRQRVKIMRIRVK